VDFSGLSEAGAVGITLAILGIVALVARILAQSWVKAQDKKLEIELQEKKSESEVKIKEAEARIEREHSERLFMEQLTTKTIEEQREIVSDLKSFTKSLSDDYAGLTQRSIKATNDTTAVIVAFSDSLQQSKDEVETNSKKVDEFNSSIVELIRVLQEDRKRCMAEHKALLEQSKAEGTAA